MPAHVLRLRGVRLAGAAKETDKSSTHVTRSTQHCHCHHYYQDEGKGGGGSMSEDQGPVLEEDEEEGEEEADFDFFIAGSVRASVA